MGWIFLNVSWSFLESKLYKTRQKISTKEARNKFYLTGLYNHAFPDERVARNHTFNNKELFYWSLVKFCKSGIRNSKPSVNDTPTKTRSATLEFAKKAISSFQQNRLLPWNEQSNSGNPMQSALVNNFIRWIKKEDVSS